MKITKETFFAAAVQSNISDEKAKKLWDLLEKEDKNNLKSSAFSKMMFYFGAMIIISAMTWLMNLSWEWFGGGGMFLIALCYAIFFTVAGAKLWKREDLRIPGGLLITIAVCMTPLAIYGLETYFEIWPKDDVNNYKDFFHSIKSSWIFMEIGTIIAGIIALQFFPFPFLTAPIFFATWFFTLDIIPLILRNEATLEQKEWISLCFGIILLFAAYVIDRKNIKDYAFWGYLFGVLTFWISLTSLSLGKGEFIYFNYLIINLVMMIFSILLKRTIFMIFGALGVFIYLVHLANDIFKDSILFPFVLSLIGLLIIYLGALYQKNRQRIEKQIIAKVPLAIRNLLPYDRD